MASPSPMICSSMGSKTDSSTKLSERLATLANLVVAQQQADDKQRPPPPKGCSPSCTLDLFQFENNVLEKGQAEVEVLDDMTPIPIVRSFNHVARECIDLGVTAKFYDWLGFSQIPRPAFEAEGIWLHGHGLNLHLLQTSDVAERVQLLATRIAHFHAAMPAVDHLAFVVDDFERVAQSLRRRGIAHRRFGDPLVPPHISQLMMYDPDGNIVELSDCAVSIGAKTCEREEHSRAEASHNGANQKPGRTGAPGLAPFAAVRPSRCLCWRTVCDVCGVRDVCGV